MIINILIGCAIGAFVGLIIGYFLLRGNVQRRNQSWLAEQRASLETERLAFQKDIDQKNEERLERKERTLKQAIDNDRSLLNDEQESLRQREQRLRRDEAKLERREDLIGDREQAVEAKVATAEKREAKALDRISACEQREETLDQRETVMAEREQGLNLELQRIAELSPAEAREELLKRLDEELEVELAQRIKQRTDEADQRAKEIATEHVARAIQRYAAEHTADTTTAKVEITDDDMKGRIIGKEGRNIRTFEQQTGVDLIVDDTPGIITISCFDGIRREIARRSLVELIEDGRIHPGRIEEVVARTQQDLDRHVLELGEDAAYDCDVSGLHPALLKLLGKLNFRTSYGQNVLQHTKEVAWLTGALAADLGLDPKLGRRCGLMHDIGKALDHEHEGSHPELGHEALKRYNENETVANAALAHHEGRPVLTVYTTLTAAADAISAARPGARRESLERYIKRLEALEDIACSFKGVRKSFAIQAGRELRVIVNEHSLADNVLPKTARSIARRIEDEVAYPGEVKVTVIRESRQTAVAR